MKMNYFVFGTNDMPRAVSFYQRLFDGHGLTKLDTGERMTLWVGADFMFGLAEPFDGNPATPGNGTMLGLNLDSAEKVSDVYNLARELGASCEGEPGIRSGRYAAYFRDMDGNKVCVFV